MFYYINIFFIFSMFGYIMECIFNFICKENPGSGILSLPWTPIYGFGSVLILLAYNFIQKSIHLLGYQKAILLGFSMMIILTIIELIGGIFIEKVFHKVFWDYRKFKFNIGKYISLEVSLIWAFSSVIISYIVIPFLKPYILTIPNYITITFIILFILDNIHMYLTGKINK